MHSSMSRSRAGIHLALFTIGALLVVVASIFAAGSVLGALCATSPRLGTAVTSAAIVLGLLLLSNVLLRREKTTLAELGLTPARARVLESGFGFAISAVLFMGVAALQSRMVGANWKFEGLPGVRAALVGLGLTTVLVLTEELLFRGVALRYLRTLCGDRYAIVLTAMFFGAYHLVGRDYWAMGAVYQFAMPVLGGLIFGWAAVRTNGLSLPIGLHLGGNWIQAAVAGFAPLTGSERVAVWSIPISSADMRALTEPDIAARVPYFAAVLLMAVTVWWFVRGVPVSHRLWRRPF